MRIIDADRLRDDFIKAGKNMEDNLIPPLLEVTDILHMIEATPTVELYLEYKEEKLGR